MSRDRRIGALPLAVLGATLLVLYGPILVTVVYSFNASRLVSVWGGASTRWYAALMTDEALLRSAWLSLRIGVASAAIATLLGTMTALTLVRRRDSAEAAALGAMTYAPMVLPDIVVGLSLLLVFVLAGIARGAGTVVVAHATVALPFVTVVVQSRLIALGPETDEAARDLGATPLVAFLTVTLPLAAPAIASGFLLAFSISLDDLVVASFTAGPGASTLPMRIYSSVRLGVSPEINAAASLMLAGVGCLVVAAMLLSGRRVRERPFRPAKRA